MNSLNPLKAKLKIIFKNSVRASNRTPHFTITNINLLILLMEISLLQREPYETQEHKMDSYWLSSHVMTQAVRRQSLTTEVRFRAGVSPCGICGGESGTGTCFDPCSLAFPCQYHSTMAFHTHISPGEWTIDTLVATFQIHCLIPSTWTTILIVDASGTYIYHSVRRLILSLLRYVKLCAAEVFHYILIRGCIL
jgi:hypothetical protein